MKRIGLIDFDTSHVAAFISRINHIGVGNDQWVEGATAVVGCPGKSIIYPERIAKEVENVKKLGLTLVESPEEMLKHNLDAVFIESNSGMQHLERAKFFLSHKLPLFIDKPFTCSRKDALEIFELADKAGVPVMSASSLRYAPEVMAFGQSPAAKNKTLGVFTYGPAPTDDKNPGLFHYGIHPVEVLFTLMGTGCVSVTNVAQDLCEQATGVWSNGRIGSVRGQRPYTGYGFVTFVDNAVKAHNITTAFIYRDLLKAIIGMLETGKSPIDPKETLEIVTFIENARKSQQNHGMPQPMV